MLSSSSKREVALERRSDLAHLVAAHPLVAHA
jgi:hypothetical protein